MTRTVWFNCCAGVAGDMMLASLIDAGADRLAVMDAWGALGIDGFAATWERVQRCGVSSLWTNLAIHEHHHHGDHPHDDQELQHHDHRRAADVIALIQSSDLPARVRDGAVNVYRTLAEVEGAIHGVDADDVELHEVGALDSILDVVGVCAALDSLGITRVTYSPIAVGHGTVMTAHGRLPNPVPAVTRLLARANASTTGLDTTMELSTPTGVALLTVLGDSCGPLPSLVISSTGFGAGTADPQGRPNVVQAIIGETASATANVGGRPAHVLEANVDDVTGEVLAHTITALILAGAHDAWATPIVMKKGRPAHVVEANVDDVTGEVLAHTIAALILAGAHDAWATPIVMKKGRPAHTVHALCDDASLVTIRDVLISETGTLGVRATQVTRWPQQRHERTVEIDGHTIRVKVSGHRVKVEHDDALAAATALGRPLRDLLAQAEQIGHVVDH